MVRKNSYVTVTDQFCGAGGSSQGATDAGFEVKLAMNHWKKAIETHNSNFPTVDHVCTDISACDPRRYPRTDILITSPECTSHSLAKGKQRKNLGQMDLFGKGTTIDPAEERSRSTMWDVPRFAEFHDYEMIVVENVVDARMWRMWDAWIMAMHLLGYDHQIVYFNSQFAHPVPQSRDRMYVVFHKRGNPAPNLVYNPAAWCVRCDKNVAAVQSWKNPMKPWGKYRQQYVYRCPSCAVEVRPYYYAAANAIDWGLPTPAIKDRKIPLKDKTMARISLGLKTLGAREPVMMTTSYGHATNNRARPVSDVMFTQTARQETALVVPPNAFILDRMFDYTARPVTDPLSTVVAAGAHQCLITPPPGFVLTTSHSSTHMPPVSLTEPLGTQTTCQDTGLVLLPDPFLISYYGTDSVHPVSDPLGTVTTVDRHALVTPPDAFIMSYYSRDDATRSVKEPLGTVTTEPRHALVTPDQAIDPRECGFRMLQPKEIKKAMGFPDDYILLGNNRQQVKLAGNAVTPQALKWIMERCMESLQGSGARVA